MKINHFLEKNSPTILTVLGVAGLVSTAVLAVRATPKAMALIDEHAYTLLKEHSGYDGTFAEWHSDSHEYSYSDRLTLLNNIEFIKATYKAFIPVIIVGGASIACIIGASSINARRNTALAGLYAVSEAAAKEYQRKVVETIGSNKELGIRDSVAKDHLARNPSSTQRIYASGKGDVLCYDSFSGRYFKSDMETLRRIQAEGNRVLVEEDFISLNDIYVELGLPCIQPGETIGWDLNRYEINFQFSTQISDNDEPCIVVGYVDQVVPKYEF